MAGGGKKSVLLVDDEPRLLESYRRLLAGDYRVSTARHGSEAMGVLKRNRVDCIVLDLSMPEMDGLEFLEKIRRQGDHTPVVIVTGRSSRRHAEACADLTVHGYLTKPFPPETLGLKIARAIGVGNGSGLCYEAPSLKPATLKKALRYIDLHYRSPLGIKEVAGASCVSPDHLARLFRKELGLSFTSYLNRHRIDRAKELIRKGDSKLTEVMLEVGYGTEQHFFRQFKKHTGLTPGRFRTKCSGDRIVEGRIKETS